MTPLIANILMHGADGPFTRSVGKWFFRVGGAIMLVAICWDVVAALVKRERGRNWPIVSAVIGTVCVTVVGGNGISSLAVRDRPYYKATLTYTYNNPEQQMGDYSRDFANRDDAEAWANSYKGETVKVHVDPRDPTRSVLREEDL
jgi:hypothetical protein